MKRKLENGTSFRSRIFTVTRNTLSWYDLIFLYVCLREILLFFLTTRKCLGPIPDIKHANGLYNDKGSLCPASRLDSIIM